MSVYNINLSNFDVTDFWIKNEVYKIKNNIFKITGSISKENLNDILKIENIKKDINNSQITFKLTINIDNNSESKDITFNGFENNFQVDFKNEISEINVNMPEFLPSDLSEGLIFNDVFPEIELYNQMAQNWEDILTIAKGHINLSDPDYFSEICAIQDYEEVNDLDGILKINYMIVDPSDNFSGTKTKIITIMMKNKKITNLKLISLSGVCCLLPFSLISCNTSNSNDYQYSVSFKNTNSFNFGDYSKLASDSSINEAWIKAKIIDNRELIFNIPLSLPSDFDWNSNILISSIVSNDQDCSLTFNLTLLNSNQNGESIFNSIKFTGFLDPSSIPSKDYIISFKSQTSFPYGDSTKLPSQVTTSDIKQKVITNKEQFFNISSNVPIDFDWEKNITIQNINSNDIEGEYQFKIVLKSYSSTDLNLSLESDLITFTGYKKQSNTNNDILLPIDPSLIPPDKYKPVPNEEEKIWGNAPLPKIPDNQITMEHLITMFDQFIGNKEMSALTFGKRMIDAKLVTNAFAKWITTRYVYFPYFAFSNPVIQFFLKDENGNRVWNSDIDINNSEQYYKTYYIDQIGDSVLNYVDGWLSQGPLKNSFYEYINNFLDLIKYDMSDIDKVYTAYTYISDQIIYEGSLSLSASVYSNTGVCADYASLMALLCNLVGVPTLPMLTNYRQPQGHEIVWVYIDLLGDGNKKWFGMDPTFAYRYGKGYNAQISFMPTKRLYENFLFNFHDEQFPDTSKMTEVERMHYNYNFFFSAPFTTIWDNQMLATKSNSSIPKTIYALDNISKPIYYDGYWYYMQADKNWENKLMRSKFFNPSPEVVIDKNNLTENGFNISSDDWAPFTNSYRDSFGYKDNIVIASTKEGSLNKPDTIDFIIINLKTKEYKKIPTIEGYFDSSFSSHSDGFNFYIENGEIYYTTQVNDNWRAKTYNKVNLSKEEYALLNKTTDLKTELYNKILLYRIYISTFLTSENGDRTNIIDKNAKRNFLDYLYELENKIKTNNINNYEEILNNLDKQFNNLIPEILYIDMLKLNTLNDVYQYSKSSVESIGYLPLNKLLIVDDLYDFTVNNNNISYDIYYSKTKNGVYKKVKSETYLNTTGINVKLSDLGTSSYDGFYYFEYYPYGLENHKVKSKIFEVQIVDSKTLPDAEGLYTQIKRNTNYNSKSPIWFNNQIVLNFLLNGMNKFQGKISGDLKYLNPESKQICILDSFNIDSSISSSTFSKKWVIDKSSNNNHGIYWIEFNINSNDSYNNSNIKSFSNFFFHFTKNDIDNFDLNLWSELTNMIK